MAEVSDKHQSNLSTTTTNSLTANDTRNKYLETWFPPLASTLFDLVSRFRRARDNIFESIDRGQMN